MSKQRCTFIAWFMMAGSLVFIRLVPAQEIRYPKALNLSEFNPVRADAVNDWTTSRTNGVVSISLTKPSFFADGAELAIQCSRHGGAGGSSVAIIQNGNPLVQFNCTIGVLSHPLPVHFFDFDGNKAKDFKLVFYLGGNAGHSNTARVYYFLQHERYWRMISFFIRDVSYTWECDIDRDGKCEFLKAHHQDKEKPGYHDAANDKWVSDVFRKYLFLNAYALDKNGLRLCNHLSGSLPKIHCFQDSDPFDVVNDHAFLRYNQFEFPDDYVFQVKRIR
jgi:hypothetical protein